MRATEQDKELYLEGIITVPKEDADGGVYTPDQMELAELVREGFLDVHHMMFEHGQPDAIIGEPVDVRVVKDGVWARFKLYKTKLAQDIWNYVREHPGVLGFSIAGRLFKPLFDRGGRWSFKREYGGSVAVTRFPMQPFTWAVATMEGEPAALAASVSRATLTDVMTSLAGKILAGEVRLNAPFEVWYDTFRSLSLDPVSSASLSTWAIEYFGRMSEAVDTVRMLEAILIPDPEQEADMAEAIAEDIDKWLLVHPDDEHFTADGKYKSLDDAIMHLRYCKRLSSMQVAKILGYLRGHASRFLARIPKGWSTEDVLEKSV